MQRHPWSEIRRKSADTPERRARTEARKRELRALMEAEEAREQEGRAAPPDTEGRQTR